MSKLPESRCGLLCSECSFRESHGCKGCTEIAQPFWGTCPVKTCCEGKKLPHCGSCQGMPCEKLKAFAYDKAQGDDGRRIAQCRAWRAATPRYRSVLLAVSDMAAAKRFYCQLLGLPVMEDIGANVTLRGGITLQQLDVWKQLLACDEVRQRHNAAELYFEIDDIEAFAVAAQQIGAEIFQQMHETPWGQRLVRLCDPDGNLVEIGEDMHIVTRRFLDAGLTEQQTAERMGVPLAYVQYYAHSPAEPENT